jgi:lipoprotein-anchoring transpeptidase ErfK/SrfK
VQNAFAAPLELDLAATRVLVTPDLLGGTADVAKAIGNALVAPSGTAVQLPVTVNQSVTTSFIAKLAKRFDRAPTNARLMLRNSRPFITGELSGRRLDQRRVVRDVVTALTNSVRDPIAVKMLAVEATVTRANFGAVIVIHRGENRLFLYNGMRYWRVFSVATGQHAYPTPLGRFAIVVKWKNPWWYPPASPWAAGQKPIPPGPGNPLGTRWMGLSASGVGIHGTPDAGSIGYSVSHGCIRMRIPDAEWLFNHVQVGTTVFIIPN